MGDAAGKYIRDSEQGRCPLEMGGDVKPSSPMALGSTCSLHGRKRDVSVSGDEFGAWATEATSDLSEEISTGSKERWWSQILGAVVGSSVTFAVTLTSGHGAVMLGQLSEGRSQVKLTGRQSQWMMSVYMLGMMMGTVMSLALLRRIGPAKLMLWQIVPNLLGITLQAFDTTANILIMGRFLAGLSIGTCSSCSVIFIGEVCSPKLRGAMLMLPGLFLALGYAISYGLGSVMRWTTLTWVTGLTPNLVMGLGLLVLHESPTWLVNHNQTKQAEEALRFYRGKDYPANREVIRMQKAAECRNREPTLWGIVKLLKLQEHLVPFLLVLAQTIGNVWSGQVAVFSYAVVIFREVGSRLNEYHCSLLLAAIRLVVSLVAASIIDRIGRRKLLLASCLVAAAGMAATGAYFYLRESALDVSDLGWVPICGLCMAVAGVSLGIDPLTWALMGELLPAAIRDQAGAVATTVWTVAYFIVVQIFPDMSSLLGAAGVFWFFMSCLLMNFVFVLAFLPETKGKTLLEIEDYFLRYRKKTEAALEDAPAMS